MEIKVFIECEAGSDQRPYFDEQTLERKGSFTVSRKYPFPYGFIHGTKSGDGDCLDCFVITKRPLISESMVHAEIVGMMEQFETKNGNTKMDHKILANIKGEDLELDEKMKEVLREFVLHVFDHRADKKVEVGSFYTKEVGEELVENLTLK
ncbi:MAG: inorganic diphosphatase [bacterium]|nr:inorganic diphosphatase [bacterium]